MAVDGTAKTKRAPAPTPKRSYPSDRKTRDPEERGAKYTGAWHELYLKMKSVKAMAEYLDADESTINRWYNAWLEGTWTEKRWKFVARLCVDKGIVMPKSGN